eukprot:Opistho-1_new@37116
MDPSLLAQLDLAAIGADALAAAEFLRANEDSHARQRSGSQERLSVHGVSSGVGKAKLKNRAIRDVRKTRSYERLPPRGEKDGDGTGPPQPTVSPRPRASTGQTMFKNFFNPSQKSPRESAPAVPQMQAGLAAPSSYKNTGLFSSFRLPRSASMPNLANQDPNAQVPMNMSDKSSNSPTSQQSQFSSTYSLDVHPDGRFVPVVPAMGVPSHRRSLSPSEEVQRIMMEGGAPDLFTMQQQLHDGQMRHQQILLQQAQHKLLEQSGGQPGNTVYLQQSDGTIVPASIIGMIPHAQGLQGLGVSSGVAAPGVAGVPHRPQPTLSFGANRGIHGAGVRIPPAISVDFAEDDGQGDAEGGFDGDYHLNDDDNSSDFGSELDAASPGDPLALLQQQLQLGQLTPEMLSAIAQIQAMRNVLQRQQQPQQPHMVPQAGMGFGDGTNVDQLIDQISASVDPLLLEEVVTPRRSAGDDDVDKRLAALNRLSLSEIDELAPYAPQGDTADYVAQLAALGRQESQDGMAVIDSILLAQLGLQGGPSYQN